MGCNFRYFSAYILNIYRSNQIQSNKLFLLIFLQCDFKGLPIFISIIKTCETPVKRISTRINFTQPLTYGLYTPSPAKEAVSIVSISALYHFTFGAIEHFWCCNRLVYVPPAVRHCFFVEHIKPITEAQTQQLNDFYIANHPCYCVYSVNFI